MTRDTVQHAGGNRLGKTEAVLTATEKVNTKSRYRVVVITALILLVLAFLTALSVGRYHIDFGTVIKILASKVAAVTQTWDNKTAAVVFTLRLFHKTNK